MKGDRPEVVLLDPAWVVNRGGGDYASVSFCGDKHTVVVGTYAEVVEAKRRIDHDGCGHDCTKRHRVFEVWTSEMGRVDVVRFCGCGAVLRGRPALERGMCGDCVGGAA